MEYLQVHPDVLKQIDTQNHRQALQQAASHSLITSMRSGQPEPPQSRWLAQQQGKLLQGVGHSLVRLGSWIGGQDTVRSA